MGSHGTGRDGTYEVIDTATARIVDKIRTGGRPHNTLCSADGKRMFLAPMAKTARDNPRAVTVVDVSSRQPVAKLLFSDAVRPIALSQDNKRLFANIDNLLGMEVMDVSSGQRAFRAAAEVSKDQKRVPSRTHGIAVRPDQKEVWTCDVHHQQVFVFDVMGIAPRQVATIPMDGEVYWLTFTPDGRTCYVSVRGRDQVAAVDTASRTIQARIPCGRSPKRLLVVTVSRKPGEH
jgi:YVTN family beta-propeller protein